MKLLLLLLSISMNAQAGTIADYCTSLVNGEIELEDGADYYSKISENILKPLSSGTQSMQVYADASELDVVVIGYQLQETAHCSLINDLENETYEMSVEKTTCTGQTIGQFWGSTYHESKKATLTYCSTPAFTEGQASLITKCDSSNDTLAQIEIQFLESNKENVSIGFQATSIVPYSFDGGEGGVSFSMRNESTQGFLLESDGEGSGSVFKEWTLSNISGEGENQRFNSYSCSTESI